MNILITGASGFIGSNLLKYIKEIHYDENNEIILLSSEELKEFKCINHKNYTFTKLDFYEKGIEQIDILIHLGAYTPKNAIDANNITKSISNLVNTLHLLDNIPSIPKKVIFISTLDVYAPTDDAITENTLTLPGTLYGQSKLFCEKILETWSKTNNVTLQILRIGHIYGEGEEVYKKILPITIEKVIHDEAPVIFTNGKERRSFLYIKDCCSLILKSLELSKYYGPINIVSSHSISILELANLIIEISGKADLKPFIQNNPLSTKDLVFNNKKMMKYLGDEEISLEEGLKKEYEYFVKKQI